MVVGQIHIFLIDVPVGLEEKLFGFLVVTTPTRVGGALGFVRMPVKLSSPIPSPSFPD